MDENRDPPADERYILGMIAGCCNENPRDEDMLAVLVVQLRLAQEGRERAKMFEARGAAPIRAAH